MVSYKSLWWEFLDKRLKQLAMFSLSAKQSVLISMPKCSLPLKSVCCRPFFFSPLKVEKILSLTGERVGPGTRGSLIRRTHQPNSFSFSLDFSQEISSTNPYFCYHICSIK